MFHLFAWTTWAVCAAVLALTIRNPLYLSLIVVSCVIVQLALGERQGGRLPWIGVLKLGALIWLVTIPFNALMIHEGSHVLFRLPGWLPLVGGPITLEAVLAGAASGLALWTLLLIFATYNTAVDATDLLRSLPPALMPMGTVASIALTFVPQMLASGRDIREAQQVRGQRFRGWRDGLALAMPLLATSFEHALQLAESMEARGFGGVRDATQANATRERILLLLGMVMVLIGMLVRGFWPRFGWIGMVTLVLGALTVAQGIRESGRGYSRSRYLRTRWTGQDLIGFVAAIVAAIVPLAIRSADKLALVYYPFPPYPLVPGFDWRVGIALCLLVTPALAEVLQWAPQETMSDGVTERV